MVKITKTKKEEIEDNVSMMYPEGFPESYVEEIKRKDEEILKLKAEIYDLEREDR